MSTTYEQRREMITISDTEQRLRSLIERLAKGLTQETEIELIAAEAWAADPTSRPPKLFYRLADVAATGDRILSVTAHEIAHLLYTVEQDLEALPFKVEHPKLFHLLVNVVEDARIERIFAAEFPGSRQLFHSLHTDVWDAPTEKGFTSLPVKWRFVLNIDRGLHDLPLLDDDDSSMVVEQLIDDLDRLADAVSTQDLANGLETAYEEMIRLMRKERNEKERLRRQAKKEQTETKTEDEDGVSGSYGEGPAAPNIDDEDPLDNETNSSKSDHENPPGQRNDGEPGGEDGSQGKRDGGEGPSGQDGSDESGSDESGGGNDEDGEDGSEAFDDSMEDVKATTVLEQMAVAERSSKNKTIQRLVKRQRQANRTAQRIAKTIEKERKSFVDRFRESTNMGAYKNGQVLEALAEGHQIYESVLREHSRDIRTLKSHLQSVLKDNARRRMGGDFESSGRISPRKLPRFFRDDYRLFERPVNLGGRSYGIAIVVDQSTSMQGYSYSTRGIHNLDGTPVRTPQMQALRATVVLSEAFDGVDGLDFTIIGFTDYEYDKRNTRKNLRFYGDADPEFKYRVFKEPSDELRRMRPMIGTLANSYGGTPLEAGIDQAVLRLRDLSVESKTIIVITDGAPNKEDLAAASIVDAKKRGIGVRSIVIGRRTSRGAAFMGKHCHATTVLDDPTNMTQAMTGIVRRLVHRQTAA